MQSSDGLQEIICEIPNIQAHEISYIESHGIEAF